MDEEFEMFKVVVIGSTGTGKTKISQRYAKNEYIESQKSTVGVQFLSKISQVRNQKVKVTLWDTAGQQRYKSLSKVYYKGASAVLIVYDVTDQQSYLDIQSWMRLANQNLNLHDVILMVVGNKMDLQNERKVPTERPIKQYKNNFDIDCWEVSAKTGKNVNQLFSDLLQKVYLKNIDIKSSVYMDLPDYGRGSSIGYRQSVPMQQQQKKQAKPNTIFQVIEHKQQEQIVPFSIQGSSATSSSNAQGRVTLSSNQQKNKTDPSHIKSQRRCC